MSLLKKPQKKAGIGAAYMTSRMATQAVLVNVIAKKITFQITEKVIVKCLSKMCVGFVFGALIIQGMIEKSSESAKRLQLTDPKIYVKLRGQNIDTAYFLVEESMAKTMDAIRIKFQNPDRFNDLLREIENLILAD